MRGRSLVGPAPYWFTTVPTTGPNEAILPETETVCVMFQDGEIHKKGEVREEKELQTLIAWLPGNSHQR